jgi:hypothetical protein
LVERIASALPATTVRFGCDVVQVEANRHGVTALCSNG